MYGTFTGKAWVYACVYRQIHMQPPLGVGRFGVLTSWPESLDYHVSSQY